MEDIRNTSAYPPFSASSALLTGGLAIAFFTLLAGATTLWHEEAFPALLSLRHGLLIGGLSVGISLLAARRTGTTPTLHLPIWAGLSMLFILSDWLPRGYTFFHGTPIRGELLLCAGIIVALIRHQRATTLKLLLPLSMLLLGGLFLIKTSGRLLFSDDLATFIYRLALLKDRFPYIPFYNPQWNGGIDQRDFFATGALNVFLLCSPIIYLFDLLSSFNFIVATLLFVVTPLATAYAALVLGYSSVVASIAGTLAITSGLLWYKWALAFGTLGFITSTALLPLFVAYAHRFITKAGLISLPSALFFTILTTLIVLWSPAGLAMVPAILCCIVYWRSVLQKKHSILAAVLILIINLPWMITFWSVSKVGSFIHPEISRSEIARTVDGRPGESEKLISVRDDNAPEALPAHIKQATKPINSHTPITTLRESAIFTNPFLLILIPAGIWLLPSRTRLLYGTTATWLVVLGAVVAPLRPQLELERMLVVLSIIGAVPAAAAFEMLLYTSVRNPSWSGPIIPTAAVGSFLLLGPFGVTNFLEQRTLIRYHLADGLVRELPEAITSFGGSGRVLFSGFVLHEVSGGHIAPFALMTDKPLMASSHVHNLWQYTDMIPDAYASKGDSGIQTFLDLYNVTAVIAHEKRWQDYFKNHPQQFSPVWERGRFTLFSRRGISPTYFLSGKGEVTGQTNHSITLTLKTSEAVVKFNYLPFLSATGCTLDAAPQEGDVKLIALSNCPIGTPITISSQGTFSRVKGTK